MKEYKILFIRFLKDKGVYSHYVRSMKRNIKEFLYYEPPSSFIIGAFAWYKHPEIEWGKLHGEWCELLTQGYER